jgi:acyl carrier protein
MPKLSVNEIRNVIRGVILELAPLAAAGPLDELSLVGDLGYHSLALLELAFALEDEFGLPPMDEERAQRIQTVEQVEEYVLDVLKISPADHFTTSATA